MATTLGTGTLEERVELLEVTVRRLWSDRQLLVEKLDQIAQILDERPAPFTEQHLAALDERIAQVVVGETQALTNERLAALVHRGEKELAKR